MPWHQLLEKIKPGSLSKEWIIRIFYLILIACTSVTEYQAKAIPYHQVNIVRQCLLMALLLYPQLARYLPALPQIPPQETGLLLLQGA